MSVDQLSPFKFYQYLLTSTSDVDVIRFLKMLTFISLDEINHLEAEMKQASYKPNTAQRILAAEVTKFVHGAVGLQQAESATQVRFTHEALATHKSNPGRSDSDEALYIAQLQMRDPPAYSGKADFNLSS